MIKGNPDIITRCRKATPEDKWNHVNFDAIDKLPDEYEAIITEVKFDFANDFSEISGSYMPKTNLMYDIAKACGISGGDVSLNQQLIEEVDYNRIMAIMNQPPNMVRMDIGRKVAKFSTIVQSDGSLFRSSVCTVAYNAYARCCELWSDEEKETNGYSVEIKSGKYTTEYKGNVKEHYGPHYLKSGKWPTALKYHTQWQRRSCFEEELNRAGTMAETQAYLKSIRELAGMVTGFKKEALKDGFFVFSRIQRSNSAIKMETAARLTALSRGESTGTAAMLFGERSMEIAAPVKVVPEATKPTPEPTPPAATVSKRESLIATVNAYGMNNVIHIDDETSAKNILEWAGKVKEPAESSQYWASVLDALRVIESKIPEEGKIHHGLY